MIEIIAARTVIRADERLPLADQIREIRWKLHVHGLRERRIDPFTMSAPRIVGDNYVIDVTTFTEPDELANSCPGWDADGSPVWEFP